MDKPIVSVITPVYNGEDYIADCIKSVACSITCDRFRFEHVIIDDGSTDNTSDIAFKTIALMTPHNPMACSPKFIFRTPNTGKPSAIRNHGIKIAKGKYIFCLDHDDILIQNSLRYLTQYLETQQPNHQVVYGDFIRASGANRSYAIGDDYYGWPHATKQQALHSIFRGDHFYQHSLMFTKSLFNAVGGYDENITYGEDLDLCIRFILHGHIPIHIPVTTHIHRNHQSNLTAGYLYKNDIWFAERRAHYHKYMSLLPDIVGTDAIVDIEAQLKITPLTCLNGPPPNQRIAPTLIGRAT